MTISVLGSISVVVVSALSVIILIPPSELRIHQIVECLVHSNS